ncbi:hypothetical protein NSTC745_05348 [Nostoc sp. DSM 114161]|jgi:hypothetical protein
MPKANSQLMRKSAGYWLTLCLEKGLVGQRITQEVAIINLIK